MSDPARDQQIHALYDAFNRRDSSYATDQMSPEVSWPRAFKGGTVDGPEAVSAYWREQWTEIDPTVVPTALTTLDDGSVDVTVHQVVRDLQGEVIADSIVHHVYRFDGDKVSSMELPPTE